MANIYSRRYTDYYSDSYSFPIRKSSNLQRRRRRRRSQRRGSIVPFVLIVGCAIFAVLFAQNSHGEKLFNWVIRETNTIETAVGIDFGIGNSGAIDNEKSLIEPVDEISMLNVLNSLDENAWIQLSLDAKIIVLQSIVDFECQNVLGCPTTNISTAELDGRTIGQYGWMIQIDTAHLENGLFVDVLHTTLHEVRHRYQQYLVSVMSAAASKDPKYRSLDIFRQANTFAVNFNDYKTIDTDGMDAYTDQSLEVDAESYAYNRTAEYYSQVLEFGPSRELIK